MPDQNPLKAPSQFCPICDGLERNFKDREGRDQKYCRPIGLLQLRRAQGCRGCELLCDGVEIFKDDWGHMDQSRITLVSA